MCSHASHGCACLRLLLLLLLHPCIDAHLLLPLLLHWRAVLKHLWRLLHAIKRLVCLLLDEGLLLLQRQCLLLLLLEQHVAGSKQGQGRHSSRAAQLRCTIPYRRSRGYKLLCLLLQLHLWDLLPCMRLYN